MEKFDLNPFDRSALTDIKLMAGRNAEFTRIRFVLRSAFKQKDRVKSILITGDRGVGKTSFLNLIEKECPQYNLIPIRLNLTESNSANSNEFFWYLFTQLLNKVLNLGFFGGIGGTVDATIQKILHSDGSQDLINYIFKTPFIRKNYTANNQIVFEFDQLIQDLTKIRQEISESETSQYNFKTKFMFLVDESQKIYSNSKIIEDIRYIIQHESIGVGFVFAGDQTYSDNIWEKVFGGSHREFEVINLNYFEDSRSVRDYFSKSLESIGWSTKEIESDLFYKFKDTCNQIFKLTSGKPAWINIIAAKMFERCMLGETSYLVFDRQAKAELKEILEESGQLDKSKLDFIEELDPIFEKWLALLFFCELSTFKQVYFYGKFILVDENEITLNAFESFCKHLVEKQILQIVTTENEINTIGFKNKSTDYLDNKYIAFSPDNDAMKQWLAISTEGRYTFNFGIPQIWFIIQIYKVIAIDSDKSTNQILLSKHTDDPSQQRFSILLNKIHSKTYDIAEATYSEVLNTYEFIKKSSVSKSHKVLFAYLKDCISGKYRCWNVYHYSSDGKLGDYWESKTKFPRFIQNIEKFNNEQQRFELGLFLDKCPEISIEQYQKCTFR